MIRLQYQGFFQCRLATDSAAYDAPRGTGGWTFAFGTEPDLDRLIRLQEPLALRSRSPTIGVDVVEATTTASLDVSSLLGCRVAFLDDAVFEGRNGSIAGDAREPISPLRVSISSGDLRLVRGSSYDVESVVQRNPFMGQGIIGIPDTDVRGVTISNSQQARAYRQARLNALQSDLSSETDPHKREILEQRLVQLAAPAGGAITGTLHSAVPYRFPLRDAPTISLPSGSPLAGKLDSTMPWEMSFWMGSWDADTLTGYMRGQLVVPTVA